MGGRLAYHLRQAEKRYAPAHPEFGKLVRSALAGKGWASGGGGVFAKVGQFLKDKADALGSAYNWHRAGDALTVDGAVKEFLDRTPAERLKQAGVHHIAADKQFGLTTGSKIGQDIHAKFWDALRSHVKGQLAGGMLAKVKPGHLSDAMLDRSLKRLRYLQEDRPEVGTAGWQEYHSLLPGRGAGQAERLARPGQGVFARLRDHLFGKAPNERVEGLGGILHEDAPRGAVERSAVAGALQRLGMWDRDPGVWREKVGAYTERARRVAQGLPDHPLVTHYTRAAGQLTSPEVKATDTGFATVPPVGSVGHELTSRVLPLIRFIAKTGGELPDTQLPEPVVPEPPPPKPGKVRGYKLAPDRPVTNRESAPSPLPAGYTVKPQPGEAGRGGLRHEFIRGHEEAGATRGQILSHLRHEFILSPRQAAAVYSGYKRRKPTKLARVPVGVVHADDNDRGQVERYAIQQALRREGLIDPSPSKQMERVGHIASAVRRMVAKHPDHPAVKGYVRLATRLKSGTSVTGPEGAALSAAIHPLVKGVVHAVVRLSRSGEESPRRLDPGSSGMNASYIQGDRHLKKITRHGNPRSEIAGAMGHAMLGLPAPVPELINHPTLGSVLSSPLIPDATPIAELTPPAERKLNKGHLAGHVLATWLLNAGDRHAYNYLADPAGNVHAIDHSVSFHPETYRMPDGTVENPTSDPDDWHDSDVHNSSVRHLLYHIVGRVHGQYQPVPPEHVEKAIQHADHLTRLAEIVGGDYGPAEGANMKRGMEDRIAALKEQYAETKTAGRPFMIRDIDKANERAIEISRNRTSA